MAKDVTPKLVPVRLLFAFFDDKGNRYDPPQVLDMPMDLAKRLMAEGKAERADPLPGED